MLICTVIWSSKEDNRTAIQGNVIKNIFPIINKSFFKGCLNIVSFIYSSLYFIFAKSELIIEVFSQLLNKSTFKKPEMQGGYQ